MRIDRYLFSEVLRPSLVSLVFYTFVLLMNQIFVVVKAGFQRGTALITVVEILLLAFPKIVVMTVPMAVLLGVLVGMGRLSADSEVIALRASGVSYFRMARPVVALGTLGFALATAIYVFAVPWTSGRMQDVKTTLLRTTDPNREIRPRVFFDEIPGAIICADELASQDTTWPLRRVFLYLEKGAEGQQTFVCGARGRLEHQADAGRVSVVVERGEIHTTDPARPEAYNTIPFEGPFRQVIYYPGDDLRGRGRHRTTQEQSIRELIEEIRHLAAIPDWRSNPAREFRFRRALTEIYWRFSLPFASLAFALVAFPLSLINQRGGRASGFALSLLIIILYWNSMTFGKDLALEGRVPGFFGARGPGLFVLMGAWGPDLIVLALALALLVFRQKIELLSLRDLARAGAARIDRRLTGGHVARLVRGLPWPSSNRVVVRRRSNSRVSIMDRYLSGRFLTIFAYVLLSVFTLHSVIELKGLVDSLLERHLPFSLGLSYLFFFAPGVLKILLPIATVMAGLVTLGAVCKANEDTALKAAGISIFRIAAPLLLVGLLISAASFAIQDYVVPYTNQRAAKILDQIEGRASSTTEGGARWILGRDSRLYSYADYDSGRQTLQGVTTIELAGDSFTVRRRTWAPRVSWSPGGWIAQQGWQRTFKDGREVSYSPLTGTVLGWPETPEDFDRQERSVLGSGRLAEEMNFLDLRRHILRMKHSGYDTTSLRVALYEKLAFPAAPLVMLLIGVPFAFRGGRYGSLYGIGIALMLVIVYWSCFAVSSALGEQGFLPPVLAAFSPNLLFTLVGGYLFLSTRS